MWFQTHASNEVNPERRLYAERLLGAGCVVWFYLYKALLPFDLAFIYPQWHIKAGNRLWWLPLLAALAVTAVLWLYRESWSRPLLFAWGFFCVSLVPVMGFTDVGFMKYSLVADHYQHICHYRRDCTWHRRAGASGIAWRETWRTGRLPSPLRRWERSPF